MAATLLQWGGELPSFDPFQGLVRPFSGILRRYLTLARERAAEEESRRMTSLIENLQQANTAQQRRITDLYKDVADLRRQLNEFENKYKNNQLSAVSQTDIRKIYDKMGEIEKSRQADNDLVKEQFRELKKLLDRPPVVIASPVNNPTPRDRGERSDRGERNDIKPPKDNIEDEPPAFNGEHFTYKIKSGDRLTQIIAAFNAKLKEEGKNKAPITLDMVKKANPKINPNNLIVGREIKIPVPPDR
jgi:hypothetical protein